MTALAGWIGKHIAVPSETDKAQSRALLGLLYAAISERCTGYINAGHISARELADLRKYFYEPYKALGGDGTIDLLMARVEALEIKGGE